jgi:hypothetical protein
MEQKKRRGAKWWLFRIAAFFVCVYVVLVLIRVRGLFQEEETQKQVEKIHSIRLTQSDVDGTKRPPVPDQAINNSTIEGVDSNKNYIRDDVELYILDAYTNLNERSAWLQWAKNRQLLLLFAHNKETLKAVMEEGSRANLCLASYESKSKAGFKQYKEQRDRLEDLVFNTKERVATKDFAYEYMSSYGGNVGSIACDYSSN